MPRVSVTIPNAWLRNVARSGRTLDEIADLIEVKFGIRRSRSWVSKELKKLGEEPRHVSRRDLIPWDVLPAHTKDRFYLMLQAESRRRQGNKLSATDSKYIEQLDNLLLSRGLPLVISYCPVVGFYLIAKTETDHDIIRDERKCNATLVGSA